MEQNEILGSDSSQILRRVYWEINLRTPVSG